MWINGIPQILQGIPALVICGDPEIRGLYDLHGAG